MRSTFYGLEIAKTGLFISRNELDVTGHNISNVDTVGYTRQRLDTSAIPAPNFGMIVKPDLRGAVGGGVETVKVDQIRDPFLDIQYRKENAVTDNWAVKEQYFGYVEQLFNNELDDIDTSTGLSAMFSNFYGALDELSQSPEDLMIRTNVRAMAQKICEDLRYYHDSLVSQQDTLNEMVKVTVGQINDIAQDIALLNEQIISYEMAGAQANDLRDQRNVMLDELSGLVDISYSEDINGYMSVYVSGQYLVRHNRTFKLAVDDGSYYADNGIYNNANYSDNVPETDEQYIKKMYGIYWADKDGNPSQSAVTIKDGALKGYLDLRDGADEVSYGIPHVIHDLNDLARAIVSEVNKIHTTGWTMPYTDGAGNTTTSEQGIWFFDQPAGAPYDNPDDAAWLEVTAKSIWLSEDIEESVYNIAASDQQIVTGADNEQRGNNVIALELCELITRKDNAGNSANFDDMYSEIITGIGIQEDHIISMTASQTVVLEQVEQQRQSVSGVSLDEEMTNVIRFGHAYNAASRVITAMDEELDTLINKMGLVGR